MTDPVPPSPADAAYHLHVDAAERPVLATALRLLIDDMAHTPAARRPAARILEHLAASPPDAEPTVLALDAPGLKVTHTALHIFLDDLGREQAAERRVVRELLDKLPDAHAIRAIAL